MSAAFVDTAVGLLALALIVGGSTWWGRRCARRWTAHRQAVDLDIAYLRAIPTRDGDA